MTAPPVLYQTTLHLTHQVRDPRVLHRAIATPTHPARVLWAQPTPRTVILRTALDVAWGGILRATAVSTTLARTRYPHGCRVEWALIANPTRCLSVGEMGKRPRGKRVGITDPVQARDWAAARLCRALDLDQVTAKPMASAHGSDRLHLTRWAYAGTGTVTDPDALARLLAEGVGRGKAFGCGLLLVKEVTG